MISAVTFDAWETIFHDDPVLAEERSELRVAGMTEALRQAGFTLDREQVRRGYQESWHTCERIWSTYREIDPGEQVTVLLAHVDPELPAKLTGAARAEVEKAYVEPIFAKPPVLNEGLVAALAALRDGGNRIGLICNTGRTPGYALRRLFASYGVLSFFDALAFSNEEAIRKPDSEIFRRMLHRLGTPAEEAVHVGDDLVADIAGAKDSGMRAVLFRPSYPSDPPVAPDAYISSLTELLPSLQQLDGAIRFHK